MEFLDHLALGFSVALSLENLAYALIGCLLGTLIGILPGIGPVATIAMLLPVTYALPPVAALIMLAGIFYGAQYGGSTTAILVNLPGESSSVVTCIDGHQLAREGRAGIALSTAALASFFAGSVATVVVAAFAMPMVEMAFRFGQADYFSLMVLGLVGAVVLSSGSLLKSLAMIVLGLLIGLVGTDVNSGIARYTMGYPELTDGLNFGVIAMGIFGLGEIIANLERGSAERHVFTKAVRGFVPTGEDVRVAAPAAARGTLLGSVLGFLPGGGAALAAFSAYALEKKVARHPEAFGRGALQGVAGPEAANNAAAQTSFIPLLTLGIPPNATMALMLGALTIHNIQPGPQVMTSNPELFWGLIASMWIGNMILVILNLPLIGLWIRLLGIPYRMLFPAIAFFCAIGVYSLNNSVFEIFVMAGFGLLGYVFMKLDCGAAPLILGVILGPMLEESFRRALVLSRGDFSVFFTRPISATLLLAAAFLVVLVLLPHVTKKRDQAFQEGA